MPDLKNITESEQMYLVTLARLGEAQGGFPIHLSHLAETLQITPVSANQGIHHLEEMGLVSYVPYRGAGLTQEGWRTAHNVLRSRRLWEVFLVEHLGYDPTAAEGLACDLEHAIPAESTERLAAFLGWPQESPQGRPIPPASSRAAVEGCIALSDMPVGTRGQVRSLKVEESERDFLRESGLQAGTHVTLLAAQGASAFLVKVNGNGVLTISAELARNILVLPGQ